MAKDYKSQAGLEAVKNFRARRTLKNAKIVRL